ncbi:hypothetical protein BN7_3892 [Wickerhamomyces ciferrii]|uniref:Carbohydrate kinase PfkB domain-containing protein n=1 Tax=Wickerhamomyces ciferrii (strain ATCC 14091 / BCRC 22168 / CBS 111 / JCM 3599 / NBRC 0793 / NRRL Y-1031 F-60-10) TaxID=1206466 RepID=K0KGP6_WICCF|nr:uncharacterized protein BN7_3892 [Wickerhamomyces ciferrii]CCH44330.1 hypothetical protein BN7_3892 [Wickerhamomyces ciferrii]
MLRSLRPIGKRCYSTLKISEEIQQALVENKSIVSLESTIITHGLPFPQNLNMAQQVEKEIRLKGAIPATTAFINGIPKVGLNYNELESLASSTSNATKVSRRDIPYVVSQKLNGGTTISGTMILSERAGIKIFATGGLGGVHRDGENSMDISADLDELSKTSVAVVCAGPKSILDIERTIEYLETKGVFVGTLGSSGTNIPGFYTRDSSVSSPYNFQNFKQAADIIHQGDLLKLNNGFLFCIPPPEEIALDSTFINGIINQANDEALAKGIKGKQLTPFLLSKIAQATKGESVKSNIEFVLNNARSATEIAIEYSKLNNTSKNFTYQPPIIPKPKSTEKNSQQIDSIVIGSVALDTYCKTESPALLRDSNPSKITSSIGGVGYNVALESTKLGNSSLKFISVVGDDIQGKSLINSLRTKHNAIHIAENSTTSQYISHHDNDGELIIAAADMGIVENNLPIEHIENEIKNSKPRIVLFDANISTKTMQFLIELSAELKFKLIFEPTSAHKSKKISELKMSVFPNNSIELATPTINELKYIYESLEDLGKFELNDWFPVIDALSVDKSIRSKLEAASLRDPFYKKLLFEGIFQSAISLLPFIKTLIIKDGSNGVYLVSIYEDEVQLNSNAKLSIASTTKEFKGHKIGILFEHYEAIKLDQQISNVTGAGDALAGSLLTSLTQSSTTPANVFTSNERNEVINNALKQAVNRLLLN